MALSIPTRVDTGRSQAWRHRSFNCPHQLCLRPNARLGEDRLQVRASSVNADMEALCDDGYVAQIDEQGRKLRFPKSYPEVPRDQLGGREKLPIRIEYHQHPAGRAPTNPRRRLNR